jgi:hypothetical protein
MTCPKCTASIPDGSQFCLKCGNPLNLTAASVPARPSVRQPAPRSNALNIALWAALIIVGGYMALLLVNSQRIARFNSTNTNFAPAIFAQPHSVPITNGALTVNAGSFSWYTFAVPPGATVVTVSGHFAATGGFRNDIMAYVLDADSFVNFRNHHPVNTLYNSGKLTQSQISATLPNGSGTYYLVFDNRFSIITPKAVQVNATLSYTE